LKARAEVVDSVEVMEKTEDYYRQTVLIAGLASSFGAVVVFSILIVLFIFWRKTKKSKISEKAMTTS